MKSLINRTAIMAGSTWVISGRPMVTIGPQHPTLSNLSPRRQIPLSVRWRLSTNGHSPSSFYIFPLIRKPGHIHFYDQLSEKNKWRAFSLFDNENLQSLSLYSLNDNANHVPGSLLSSLPTFSYLIPSYPHFAYEETAAYKGPITHPRQQA